VKAIVAGDHSDDFHHGRAREIDVYSVGMGKRTYDGLFFAICTVDADGELDLQPIRLERPKEAPRQEKNER